MELRGAAAKLAGPPVGPPLSARKVPKRAMSDVETRSALVVVAGRAVKHARAPVPDGGCKARPRSGRLRPPRPTHPASARPGSSARPRRRRRMRLKSSTLLIVVLVMAATPRLAANNGLKWAICSVRSAERSVGFSGRPLDAFSSSGVLQAKNWHRSRGATLRGCDGTDH